MNLKSTVVFLILNFGALALGSYLMGKGASSEWYRGLQVAPWTPPGWVFGAAWFSIMLCFSLYMGYAWDLADNIKVLIALFSIQWILNVLWNPVFFNNHMVLTGLVVITALTILMAYILLHFYTVMRWRSILLLPYVAWLVIATSLNAYIYFKN